LDKETSEIKAVEKEKPPKAEITVIISLFRHGLQRDIPKIIKFKATNSLRVSCLFCIFKHSPQKTV
jgi:hypothetical protein